MWLHNMQIASAWMDPSDEIICHELWVAVRQLNEDLEESAICLGSDEGLNARAWEQYLSINRLTRCMARSNIALYKAGVSPLTPPKKE